MTIIVADYGFTHPRIAQLLAAKVGAVGRYFGQDTSSDGKNVTRTEAQLLSAAGISVFSIFEYGAQQTAGGAAQAAKDVTLARQQRHDVGMPFDRPFYFAADFDVPDYAPQSTDPLAKLGPVGEYYSYIHAHMGSVHAGAYGGYWLISRLFDAGLITFGFQTVAWSGGQWDKRACLRQGGATILGGEADLDTPERTDFGQWTLAPTPPSPPQQDGYLVLPGQAGGFTGRAVTSTDAGRTWS